MHRSVLARTLGIGLIAAATASPALADSTASATCELPEGWSEIAASDSDFIVLGELHGTKEGPALVESIVCALASRGERVLLAVEFSSMHNTKWQEAWELAPDAFAEAIKEHGWRGRMDGVASEAMWQMVTKAHALKASGAAVDIVAFNGARDEQPAAEFADLPAQEPHEAAQAANIAEAARSGDYDTTLVLVGNAHAALKPIFGYEPMAPKLKAYGSVMALNMTYATGASWSCQMTMPEGMKPGDPVPQNAVQCAEHTAKGLPDPGLGVHMALGAFPGRDPSGYFDGYFWVGPISASPPAVPEEDEG